ncbi:hypothetical protein J7K74_03160 [Candidatus Woesearchaeota archaeon]|nr:hypothetical protein [Candidatus Woesearchaeota archaeon]
MKKKLFSIMLLLLLVPLVSANSLLKASIISYNPVPAAPGQLVDVWIQLSNGGTDSTKMVGIEVLNNSVFSVYGDESLKTFQPLQPYKNIVVKYTLMVSRNAPQGTNYLKIRYTSDYDSNTWIETELPIEVLMHAPTLIIKEINRKPETVRQGEEVLISMRIANQGSSLLKDIRAVIDTSDKMICSGQSCEIVESPFYPLTSTNIVKSSLAPGKETILNYRVLISPSSDSGIYRLPLTITFYDETGVEHTQQEEISIIVKSDPELVTTLDDVKTDKGLIEPTISISNTGLEPVKALRVMITKIDGAILEYPLGEYYLGNIDPDDDAVLKLGIIPTRNVVNITLRYSYMDSMNKEYEEEETLEIKMPKKQSKAWIWGLVGIIVVIGIIVWIKKKRK